jgi:hypothetical protein
MEPEMKRSIVTILVLGLLAGSLVSVAEAKKKKPKKKSLVAAEQTFYLHWDSDGATPPGCAGAVYMSLEDKKGDSTCSTTTQFAQEALVAAGEEPISYLFPAADGVPFVLDASRNLKGAMVLRGTYTYDAFVHVVLSGEVDGSPVKLAEGDSAKGMGVASNSVQGMVQLPGPHAELPIDLAFDKAYDKKTVTKLNLQVIIRGHHRGGLDYELNPSHIIVPIWK